MTLYGTHIIAIPKLAQRAEGPRNCNEHFLAASRRNLQLRGPSPSARLGMTYVRGEQQISR
jgi:hypothetical protein